MIDRLLFSHEPTTYFLQIQSHVLDLQKKLQYKSCIDKLLLHKNNNDIRVKELIGLELDENPKFQFQFIILSINGTFEMERILAIVF